MKEHAWVRADTEDPQDLEEEEREERMAGLLDRYATRKRKRQVSFGGESDTAPAQTMGPSHPAADGQPTADGGSEGQAIIILASPESGPIDQTEQRRVARSESNEDDPAPSALQVIPPSDQAKGQPSRSKYMRSGLPRPILPDRIITDNYLPPRGPKPPRVEVPAPRAEEVKRILRRWEPFHCRASAADRLGSLYPHMFWMSVVTRGMGLCEDYTMSIPAGTGRKIFC